MYIIELFLKIKEDIKKNKIKKESKPLQEEENCSHFFVPIDSTGKVLACKHCGIIYKLKKGENNPFAK